MYAGAATLQVKHQTRCLAAVLGDQERHRFLTGSTSLREPNELVLLEYNEDSNAVQEARAYQHPGEIWHISPSPRDAALAFTSYTTDKGEGSHECALWRLPLPPAASSSSSSSASSPPHHHHHPHSPTRSPGAHGSAGGASVGRGRPEPLASLPKPKGRVRSVAWSPELSGGAEERVVSVDEERLALWALGGDGRAIKEVGSGKLAESLPSSRGGSSGSKGEGAQACAWDPHDPNKVAVVQGPALVQWDLRTCRPAAQTEVAHRGVARDVDFNRSKPYYLVTCGEDRLVKFWDARKPAAPVKHLAGHTHWVWTVRFNRCHDQLLLSGGTDSLVNLWRVSSISSAPLLEMEDPSGNDSPDVRVKGFDEHEESVYALAWSAADPFLFASASYDGRVVVNAVPPSEKYKILL